VAGNYQNVSVIVALVISDFRVEIGW
jgi:hypothetical protein